MPNNPHRCVIDRDGYYVTFVLLVEQDDGSTAPYSYSLKSGESLIETSPPSNMITPRWINGGWREMATPEQIEAAKPEPLPPAPPSDLELFAVEISTMMAVMQQQNDLALAELTTLIAMGMEVNSDVQ